MIASVSSASLADVDRAVAAAKEAFENGEWGRMNARERGRLMYKYVKGSMCGFGLVLFLNQIV